MSITTVTEGNKHIVKIQGRFDFGVQAEFRQAYEKTAGTNTFILDFSGTQYMDSSALGMLLLLRDYAGGDSAKIELKHCQTEIKNILEISNFQKLFKIS